MIDGIVPSSPRWIKVSSVIAARLSVLPGGGVLSIDLNGTEVLGAPYVQIFRPLDGGPFLAEFSCNEFLGATFRMTDQRVETMLGLGWIAPDSPRNGRCMPELSSRRGHAHHPRLGIANSVLLPRGLPAH